MSVPADHDDELDDELLRRVVAELRRPVRLDPAVDLRALRAIREGDGRVPAGRTRVRLAALAGAALAAGLLLTVLLRPAFDFPGERPVVRGTLTEATRTVSFRLAAPASSRVAVVGDFNDWDPAATPLRPASSGGVW
ncbi:MAG TPA: hypothetical protein VEB59_08335, partial [Gemmatimonadales bacterium]|nr:hypothetical protein [Gemmatimonadales bacterium]